MLIDVVYRFKDSELSELNAIARSSLRKAGTLPRKDMSRRAVRFHWPIEFPEVFDRRGGFDAIITNPPFVEGGTISDGQRAYFNMAYECLSIPGTRSPASSSKINLVTLFGERLLCLLNNNGSASLVCPTPVLRNERYWRPRQVLLGLALPTKIFELSEKSFGDASVEPCAIVFNKSNNASNSNSDFRIRIRNQQGEFPEERFVLIRDVLEDERFTIRISGTSSELSLVDRIESRCDTLEEFFSTKDGINPGRKDFRPILLGTVESDLFFPQAFNRAANSQVHRLAEPERFNRAIHKKTINGRDFGGLTAIEWSGIYLRYDENIAYVPEFYVKGTKWSAQLRKKAIYDRPIKVVSRQTAKTLIATVDRSTYFPINNVHVHYPTKKNKVLCCLCLAGLLNSDVLRYVYEMKSQETGKVFPQVHISKLRKLPIPKIESVSQTDELRSTVEKLLVNPKDQDNWNLLNASVNRLYRLSKSDVETIKDNRRAKDGELERVTPRKKSSRSSDSGSALFHDDDEEG